MYMPARLLPQWPVARSWAAARPLAGGCEQLRAGGPGAAASRWAGSDGGRGQAAGAPPSLSGRSPSTQALGRRAAQADQKGLPEGDPGLLGAPGRRLRST